MSLLGKKDITVSFHGETIIKVILLIVATLLGLKFLNRVAHPLELIFISFFLALALNPAVSWITDRLKSRSRARATAVAYLAVLSILIFFFSLVLPPLIGQTVGFIKDLPQNVQNLQTEGSAPARLVHRYHLEDRVQQVSNDLSNRVKNLQGPILSTAGRVGATIVSIIAVFVMTFMMLVEGPYWLEKLWAIQAEGKRAKRKVIAHKMYRVVTGYVNGQLIVALIGAGFALVSLLIISTVLHVSINAVALAGILVFTGLIPLIGNMLGAVIVVLACLLNSAVLAVVMAVYFLIYLQLESTIIHPHIQSKTSTNLTPLLVFIAALLGAGLGGLLGALVAIPVMGCLKILVEEHYANRVA